ncbi:MAG: thrombospondin type 3 repeat-containing protein [Deltaproteobacteria bacterium]|nr:thrombospondin type 3 repeat-containing protein [Deltaproteobacteria bacterium]
MNKLLTTLGAAFVMVMWLAFPGVALAQNSGGECSGGLCGTPNQSGGGCGCGCGSVLVAMTDRGDTYQFADDFDGDGIEDEFDNCPFLANYDQADGDSDAVGDSCDNCALRSNPEQSDIDGPKSDGSVFGDACDPDIDGDGILNASDNCALVPNRDQLNNDSDAYVAGNDGTALSGGDACDPDDDNDGAPDISDPCRLIADVTGGAGCDDDPDGDDIPTAQDNCPYIYNPIDGTTGVQLNMNLDAELEAVADGVAGAMVRGDACDLDKDGDGVQNFEDNCPGVSNPTLDSRGKQIDTDMDGLGDAGGWESGGESCDSRECYVIGGDRANCLDPNAAFSIYLTLVGERLDGKFQVDREITVALFSNRLTQWHNWTASFTKLPDSSDASIINAKGSGATLDASPQVANCLEQNAGGECTKLNNMRFTPDAPGQYVIKVHAELPNAAGMGQNAATFSIMAEVEGEPKGGCAATGSSAGLVALALGLVALRRRRR